MGSAVRVDIKQGTPEWLKWRQTGIGASDVAALFGKSPYKTARDLFFEKSGLAQPDDEDRSFIFEKGHEAEAELRELFRLGTGIQIVPACFENGIFLGSLDGYAKKGQGVFEAKLVGKEVLKRAADHGEIPEHHSIQIQSQLHASDEDKGWWGGKAPKVKDGVAIECGRNEKVIKMIREKGEQFWEQVQTNNIPELTDQDTLWITDDVGIEIFRSLSDLYFQKKRLEERFERLALAAKELSTHTKVRWRNVSITEVEKSGSIDYKKVPEVKMLGEDYLEKFRSKSSSYKRLLVRDEG